MRCCYPPIKDDRHDDSLVTREPRAMVEKRQTKGLGSQGSTFIFSLLPRLLELMAPPTGAAFFVNSPALLAWIISKCSSGGLNAPDDHTWHDIPHGFTEPPSIRIFVVFRSALLPKLLMRHKLLRLVEQAEAV